MSVEDRARDVVRDSVREERKATKAARRKAPRRQSPIADLATHPRPFVLVRPLAAYLECDPRTILRMIAEKALAATKVGREWRIPTEAARSTFHAERHQDS